MKPQKPSTNTALPRKPTLKAIVYSVASAAILFFSIRYYGDVREGLIIGVPFVLLVIGEGHRKQLVAFYLVFGAFIAFMLMGLKPAYLSDRRIRCRDRLEVIGAALQWYHDRYQRFPPPFTRDANGKPDKSWRELILPHISEETTRDNLVPFSGNPEELYDCTKLRRRLYPFEGYEATSIAPHTAYVAVVGKDAGWSEDQALRRDSFIDGLENTILVLEIGNSQIPWDKPRDITIADVLDIFDERGGYRLAGSHIFAQILLADGTVQTMSREIDRESLRSMLTRCGFDSILMTIVISLVCK